MSEKETYTCNLTTEEIGSLISSHAMAITSGLDQNEHLDRMTYLANRLKKIAKKDEAPVDAANKQAEPMIKKEGW